MIKYPNDFKNSVHNVKVKDEMINQWIKEGISELKSNPNLFYHLVDSGDTNVLIYKLHEGDGGGFKVLVNKNFDRAYFENEYA